MCFKPEIIREVIQKYRFKKTINILTKKALRDKKITRQQSSASSVTFSTVPLLIKRGAYQTCLIQKSQID